MAYITIRNFGEDSFEEKKSEFIGYAKRVENEEDAKAFVAEIKNKSGITDCAVVVTRYFGGILLGAGGLTRAYTKGASIAVKAAGVVEKVEGLKLSANIDYDLFGKIQYICGQNNWHIEDTEYTDSVTVHILTEKSIVETIENEFVNSTNGKVVIAKSEEGIYFKEENRLYKGIE